MAASDVDARRVGGNQRQRDAARDFRPQQMIGVVELERETQQGRHRRQRDIALFPGDAHAEHILVRAVIAVAHGAVIGDRTRIGAGERAGQRETRDLLAAGQAAQVFVLLFLRAVVQQQFGRSQRIGHHHRHCRRAAARSDLGDHGRLRLRGEFQPAVFLRDDHAEETLVLDELPHFGRQVLAGMGDVPVVQHRAQLLDLVVEEGLFLVAQPGLGQGQQFLPVRVAAEQFAVPAHGTGIERFLLGLRDLRQYLAEYLEDEAADQQAAQCGDAEYGEEDAERDIDRLQRFVRYAAFDGDQRNEHCDGDQPTPDGGAKEG